MYVVNQLARRILKTFSEGIEVRFDIVDSDSFERIQDAKGEE